MTVPFETYIRHLLTIRLFGAAVPETSYYGALEAFLNEIGKGFRPKVICILTLQNRGAGLPDGGLFTADQIRREKITREAAFTTKPDRGVIEAKPFADEVQRIAETEQVKRYLEAYGQVLVTTFREFLFIAKDRDGKPVKLESYCLAESEDAFWTACEHPQKFNERHGERLTEFLSRVLLHAYNIQDPKDVAWFLASYARDALALIEHSDLPTLNNVRDGLSEALGLKFEDEKGQHFFRSTLIQTLFYGVFSGWVIWCEDHPSDDDARFDWRLAAYWLRVPMISTLFELIARPTQLGPLKLDRILDLVAGVLNRVIKRAFFERFEKDHAITHFYEPFLAEFDPDVRKELGVWYTPIEVVKYQVARVDRMLRDELDISDGLADPNVFVLDGCCGTGTYLLEVLRRIKETLDGDGGDALAAHKLKKAAMERVFGFELLPAPFVIAHLQLGLLLHDAGAPLAEDKNERVAVYLTNALTGWEPPKEPKTRFLFPEMEIERSAADKIKRDAPILVILGNPPYNGFAGIAVEEERDLSEAYRTTKRASAPQGQGLNDLYVRFYRMADRRIAVMTGKGIVSFISNYSWLDGLSFTGMRERYLEAFDSIWIDCLNGDKYKTGKVTPDGEPDPSIFSTELNREGIQVGTAIATLVRKGPTTGTAKVSFRQLWGKEKRTQLLEEAKTESAPVYEEVSPSLELGFPFITATVETEYLKWPLLSELFPVSFSGVQTKRDELVVDIDKNILIERIRKYFDTSVTHEEITRICPRAMTKTARFDPIVTRNYLLKRGYLPQYIVRYCYRPFDMRWVYWEPETRLLGEKVAAYFPHVFTGNRFLFATGRTRKSSIEPPLTTQNLCDLNCMDSGARGFPLFLVQDKDLLINSKTVTLPNLSKLAESYITSLKSCAETLLLHVSAILASPAFREENCDAIRGNWPRVPLSIAKEVLLASATLGRRITELLDPESQNNDPENKRLLNSLKFVAVLKSMEGERASINPDSGHLELLAGWGYAGQGGATMPGRGKLVERPYSTTELASLEKLAASVGLSSETLSELFGGSTTDVFLNDVAYWRNIPKVVWEYTLGGYQVIKKWLSYREKRLLGRSLAPEEAEYVSEMTRRIAAIILLGPKLNENYFTTKQNPYTGDNGSD